MMKGGSGSIVNMSSQMGHVGSPRRTVYCMTKHGIEGLTKAMAVELGPHGIRVNTVSPTFIETPLTRPFLEDPEFSEFVMGMIAMKRLGTVDEVAAAVLSTSRRRRRPSSLARAFESTGAGRRISPHRSAALNNPQRPAKNAPEMIGHCLRLSSASQCQNCRSD